MGLSLFPHNQRAYESALSMLNKTGKAAIIHPTGTGKSFIGFRLCNDFPGARVCWLSPSEYIFTTQIENWSCAGGDDLSNIVFFTYSRLMNLTDDEIALIRPDYIVLDEFHRCGAEMWGAGIQTLLHAYPDVPILGLSATAIRYLDNQRNMADELFDGNIASEITLGEAIVRGILNPPKYVLSVFSYKNEYDRYRRRAEKIQSPWVRDKAEQYLEALKRTLEKADGLDAIFDKHMTDRTGKYIVFCANYDHMMSMISYVPEWFGKIDAHPHVYSVYSYDPTSNKAFADFRSDDDDSHLRLLFCIDALNEGIHVSDVSGVILLRPTISPIVYKQQIGRAMSAGKSSDAVIFDIVDNVYGLSSIDSVREEMDAAVECYRYIDGEGLIVNEQFKVYDEVRECRALFDELDHVMSASWEQMYDMARQYYSDNGNLLPSATYTTDEGYRLGQWVITQRTNYIKKDPSLTQERIGLLESIGMSWKTQNERFWDETYAVVKDYYERNRTLDGILTYSPKAYSWLVCQRQKYRSDALTDERIRLLNDVGMVWEREDTWQTKYEAAREYYRKFGNLDIPSDYVTESGITLGFWYRSVRNQYRDGTLSDERIGMLEAIGIDWMSVKTRTWMRYYNAAKRYRNENGNADIPSDHVTDDGLRLGIWICGQRRAKNNGKLTAEQVAMLELIGLSWQRDDTRWNVGFEYAERYFALHGNLNVVANFVTPDGFELGRWLSTQRTRLKQGKISDARIAKLNGLGICWDPNESMWQEGYERIRQYVRSHGNTQVPLFYIDDDGYKLGAWLANKKTQYKKGNLSSERIRALEEVGVIWNTNDERWQAGYDHAESFFRVNGHLNVPREYISPDGYKLSVWLSNVKNNVRRGKVDDKRLSMLNKIGFDTDKPKQNAGTQSEKQYRGIAI